MNKTMNMDALVLEAQLQSRTEISETAVSEYAEAIVAGDEFPAVLVYWNGIHHYLTDGYHRYFAHKRAGKVGILCQVVNGTLRDAVLHSVSVNSTHGMRRTHADKRKAVMTMLDDLDWVDWSSSKIAKHCGVSVPLVILLRGQTDTPVKYERKGKTLEMKKPSKRPVKQVPEVIIKEPDFDVRDEVIETLQKEAESLTQSLAVANSDGTEEQKAEANEMINSLKEELRVIKIELIAVKFSRDAFQKENAQLKQQCAQYQRQIKKQA